jgi:hypothetical protein
MPSCTIARGLARREAGAVSYDENRTPPDAPPSPAYAPGPPAPQPQSGTSGWLIAFAVVVMLALGGLAAAIISNDDSGQTSATLTTVTAKTTTVQKTTTVTTPTAPANVTVAPNITLSPSGTPEPVQGGSQTETSTAAKTTSTP